MKYETASVSAKFLFNVLQSPEVLGGLTRSAIRKRVTSQFDFYMRPDGYSQPFTQINIKLTNNCNLRCKMCGQWGETGWHIIQPKPFVAETVAIDVYRRMLDEVADYNPWIVLSGGEATLYRDILPLVSHVLSHDLMLSIITNGVKLDVFAEDFVNQGVPFVISSIDGPRQTHDEIRGIPGAFDKTVNGLKKIKRLKDERGAKKPFIMALSTISKDNAGNLEGAFEAAEDIGADYLLAYMAYFQTEESCAAYVQLMQNEFGITPRSQYGWLWSASQVDTGKLIATMRRIRSRKWSFPYNFAPQLKEEDIPRYYTEHSNSFGYHKCVAPWTMVEIMPNGDAVTCRDYPDYAVGNINDTPLKELWNNDRYRRFRNGLQNRGKMPICSRCCGMMDW
jgi:radical SAM protein with 4Fe4S-binding SPASM domain